MQLLLLAEKDLYTDLTIHIEILNYSRPTGYHGIIR